MTFSLHLLKLEFC